MRYERNTSSTLGIVCRSAPKLLTGRGEVEKLLNGILRLGDACEQACELREVGLEDEELDQQFRIDVLRDTVELIVKDEAVDGSV